MSAPDSVFTAGDEGGDGPDFSLQDWREIAPAVWVAVAEPATVNLGLVVGRDRALLVDTGSSPTQGRAVRASVTALTDRPLAAVVATHWHYDHAFGLAASAEVETVGHESLTERLRGPAAARAAAALGVDAKDLRPPRRGVAVAAAFDLGDRRVEVAHLGRGHTDGDLVVVVAAAALLFAGGLVESAGPPAVGAAGYPHEWPATLDGVLGLMTGETLAVPGHGEPVGREFVFEARGRVAAVSAEVRRLVELGIPAAEALRSGSWPYPVEHLADGVAAAYAQVSPPVHRRRLPLA